MFYSLLQRHILKECFAKKGEAVHRRVFNLFYKEKGVRNKDKVNAITKCLERLVDKGLLIGYGTRTPKKWFIREVKITRQGIKKWVEWIASRQAKLPF